MLTNDKKRLTVFEHGITIDQNLPKWKNAAERAKDKAEAKKSTTRIISRERRVDENGDEYVNMDTPFTVYSTPEPYEVKETVDFDKVASATIRELTVMIKGNELNNILSGYGGMHGWGNTINNIWTTNAADTMTWRPTGRNIFKKATEVLKKKREPKPEFDVIEFFTLIKNASKESATEYVDRVSKYLKAIYNAKNAGQTALLETLLSKMIANKYEAQLASEGFYYAVDEKLVVDFAKKTEKGLSLTYLKNFTRPLPQEVVDMLVKVNGFEVFDNYLVLHYDPEGKSYKETKKEEAKRKDPILFGVIAGSDKLYYITDWVDDYCDLTLDKFVDVLGIDKEDLNMDGNKKSKTENKEEKSEKKQTKKSKPKTTKKKAKKTE